MHVPMVGDGNGGHAESGGFFDQVVRADSSIEQRKLCVAMQVDERHLRRLNQRADFCRMAVSALIFPPTGCFSAERVDAAAISPNLGCPSYV
jgi:hypothetical protein